MNKICNIFRANYLLLFFLFVYNSAFSQVVRIDPPNPPITENVTIYYDASEGNKSLMNYKGDVYLHTGVITNRSLDGHDWKYVVGNWGTDDKRVIMKREGPNLYSMKMQIKSFYNLRDEDVAQQLAFVFRNADGTIVGKTSENEDITVPVNGYKPPEKVLEKIVFEKRVLQKLEKIPDGWKAITSNGSVFIKPFSSTIIEISFSPDGSGKQDSSNAVVMKPEPVQFNPSQQANGQLLRNGDLQIYANNNPYYLAFIYKNDTILREEAGFFQTLKNEGLRFNLSPGEAIYGTGERAIPMNRRGYKLPLYNRPFYAYELGATMLNYSVPMTLSSKRYAVLFDNPQKGYVDIGKTEPGIQEWGTMGGTLRYYVITGKDWPSILQSYTQLTGRQPLPPRWALGNLQSRMAYRNQKETDSIVTLMQKNDFPIDAIIIDFYWFGDSIKGHLGNLDWYRRNWPDPVGMISKFRKQGVKTILITEPYVIDSLPNYKDADAKKIFVTDSNGKTYLDKQFYFGAGSLIDIFKPEARDWFWQKYKKQIDKGVAAWWGDLGEPESHPADIYHVNGKADQVHNIYGHNWDKMLFDKYSENYPHTRLFHLQRSGFAGSQRFAAYPWTGDVSRSWGGLQTQLPLLLTMSMNGLGYIHSDAGGFAQGVKDEELYTRWLQFAVFTPILRPHGSDIPSEPVFWPEKTQDIVRKYMKLRYAMMPYNYTLAWQNATTGAPLMRPLFFNYADDTTTLRISNEYLWGDNLLVVPVITKGITSLKIYFHEGTWFDFNSGKEYAGKQWIDYPLSIEHLPVFAKAGGFIPMMKPINSVDNYKSDEFIIRYYPKGNSEFLQYEDNGLDNLALKENNFELISYSGMQKDQQISISLSKKGNWEGMPAERKMTFEVKKSYVADKVLINGKEIKKSLSELSGKDNYQFADGWLKIHFIWKGEPIKIEIVK
jgi:oligosaccharide 4-alpha-D-glucosyltransferase